MVIRPARLEDARDLARVQVTAWHAAYKGLIPDRVLDAMTIERRDARWQQILAGEQRRRTLVAEENGSVVGFASHGACRDDDKDRERTGEIYALYVAPGRWRQGHGSALIEQAEAFLARQGFSEVTLWVLDNNQRARRFYETRGYAADGAMKLEQRDEDGSLLEARYRKALQPAPPGADRRPGTPIRGQDRPFDLEMDSREQATARGNSYALLSQLYLQGLTGDLLPLVADIPDVAAVMPEPFDPNEAAATFQHLFGFNVFPHESIFLDPQSMLGGPFSDAVAAFCAQCGWQPAGQAAAPDHIGHELGLLAFLCAAEAGAWQDGETGQAARNRSLQRRFLDEHLLRWLPALAGAIRQQEQPFFAALADLTLDLAIFHREMLGEDLLAGPPAFNLPDPPALLDSKGTGLKDIAAFLLTPAYSGLYLSRDDIGRLGRPLRLPRGFGERRQMLTNLLHSAVEYDSLPDLLALLAQLTANRRAGYRRLDTPDGSMMSVLVQPWLRRLAGTDDILRQLRSVSLQVGGNAPDLTET